MYWGLVLLASLGLVPSLLLPEWRHYQALCMADQIERAQIERLERELARQTRLLEAVRVDPAVVYRLAERDLGIQIEPGSYVSVAPIGPPADASPPLTPEPVKPPAWIAAFVSHLPDLDYDAVFCEPQPRRVMIVMSTAVLCVAFVLYGRRYRATPGPSRAGDVVA
ncbi:MAG: hypothetical protein C4547_10765 [Phycisphaerales bacterium]|nr:MAG: hypothetical protein C4547_10765 [Phycisphaerales bacterium]